MKNQQHFYSNQYVHLGIIMIVSVFSFFINNQIIPADLMESRNLATAQEMVKYGNYLLPTMNGEPRLEKPPLPTWIAAAIEHVAPHNLVIQRYAAGIAATLLVIFLYLFVSRLTRNNRTGLIASLILATSFNIILMGRTATWDIYTHCFMLGAIYFITIAFEEKGAQWKYFLLTGLFTGLSFLSKGPVSLYALFLPFLISYIIVYRPSLKEKKAALAGMILLAVIVSCWWYGYTYLFHQDFAVDIAEKESSSWLNHNVRPLYYYWKFAAEAGIWALFWITAIVYFFMNKQTIYQKEYKFAFIWFLSSLILLSIIPEKKTRYLLPLLVPGAMLMGFYIYQMIIGIKTKSEKILFRINAIIISIILIALPIALYILFYKENQLSLAILIIATICSWSLCGFILWSIFGKKGILVTNVFSAIILTMMMVTGICLIPIGSMFINEQRHSIRLVTENDKAQGLPLYHDKDEFLRMELVYEVSQRINALDLSDEAAIRKATPFVLISGESADSIMANKNVTVEYIDTYDNNWRKPDHKRHNDELVRQAAIIRAK
ncbi:MAG: glycosyltransferase family 39 protein [Tannerella sp.]|jgi:4-amino-4-deoxy-L-arabinose transferase-like glycosyltransferase|nr:glycosyltransferase family 39 protein [Tannerella sp.]